MNKYDWIDLKDEFLYWVTGRQPYGYFPYISVKDRLEELKEMSWRLLRRAFYCPFGKHYVKWNSGDPKCILCNKRYNEIFK